MRINKRLHYAIDILKLYTQFDDGILVTATGVSKFYGYPFDTVAKILQGMNNAGILKSKKGVNGGYTLVRKLHAIDMLELSRIINGDKSTSKYQPVIDSMLETINVWSVINAPGK